MYSTNSPTITGLQTEIEHLIHQLYQAESKFEDAIEEVHPNNRDSARNLIHYLALRSLDLRNIQEQLAELSISSFAHAEGYILNNLLNIQQLLMALDGHPADQDLDYMSAPFSYRTSKRRLRENAVGLFGQNNHGERSWIMVTLATEAGEKPKLIEQMMANGMNIARINTSHDNPEVWKKMIKNIRRAERKTGTLCKVYFDLAGPKIRTDFTDIRLFNKERKVKKDKLCLFSRDLLFIAIHPKDCPSLKKSKLPKSLVACIGLTLPEVLEAVEVGQRLFFDDGKISARVVDRKEEGILVEITAAAAGGTKLRHNKGINLPDTILQIPSLAEKDFDYLPFIAAHGDIIGYSFVKRADDVYLLQNELSRLKRPDIGLVLKIENKEAFDNLPDLLLAAMRSPKAGVMIARGDLAVELGFERIAEVQEEILWICEAAHLPNIWATQVLESMAQKGLATRSEITDAAMAARAECVMLNKGPFISEAVKILADILGRMSFHIDKKHGSFRALSVARRFIH
jgi:pyruvate kinase